MKAILSRLDRLFRIMYDHHITTLIILGFVLPISLAVLVILLSEYT